MPFYTPSPMVNFNYEPAKSDARRILDTQKEIKQEQQKDQEFETDMMIKQQAYELGKMKMQQAQVEADELLKQKRLDDLAAQTFQGIVASGGSKADGYKAVQELYLREGGWAAGQKAKEEAANAWKEAWDMADINPAAAEEAAELANSMAPAGSPRMTAQSIMEAKKRIKAESKKPIELENGDVLMPQPDGTFKVQNFLSDFTRSQMQEQTAMKKRELDIRAQGQQLDYAASMANVAESKAARQQRTEEKKEAMSFQEKEALKTQKQLISSTLKEIERAEQKLASPDSNDRMAMIAALTGNSELANLGSDEAKSELLVELINRRKEQLAAGIDSLETLPGGKETAASMRQTLAEVLKPTKSKGKGKTDKPEVKKPATVFDYDFMKKRGNREYPR
jgi:hypothetical protein